VGRRRIVVARTDIPAIELAEGYWRERGAYLARLYTSHGPIVRARLGQTEVVFLLGPEANRFVLLTHRDAFSCAQGWSWVFGRDDQTRDLLTMDGAEHACHRAILHPALAAHDLERYVPSLTRIIDRRLGTWAARAVVDVYEEMRVVTLDVVAELLLGLSPGAELTLCRAVFLHGANHRSGEFAALLRAKIAERRQYPSDDALGMMAQARDGQGQYLSDDQILAHADTLLIAGHETSASLGAWALYLLAAHQGYARRVLDELTALAPDGHVTLSTIRRARTLTWALNETERLYPPVPAAPRGTLYDVEFMGHRLRKGTMVLYSAAASHLLSEIWTAPGEFDPDRFAPPREEHKRVPFSLVGFGGGPRVCVGRTLARTELSLMLARALFQYELTVVPGQRIAQRFGVTCRPVSGIRLHARRATQTGDIRVGSPST
jgi:retinoid hydroxylase